MALCQKNYLRFRNVMRLCKRAWLVISYSLMASFDRVDNLQVDEVVYASNTIRYDDPDPYLVVAADKEQQHFQMQTKFPRAKFLVTRCFRFWWNNRIRS